MIYVVHVDVPAILEAPVHCVEHFLETRRIHKSRRDGRHLRPDRSHQHLFLDGFANVVVHRGDVRAAHAAGGWGWSAPVSAHPPLVPASLSRPKILGELGTITSYRFY